MDTSAHVNILTSFLGQLQDFLTPQEFSNYAIIEMRIENIINFLNTLFLVLPKLEPGQLRVSYLVNARKRLVNTLFLTVFNPTSESRQFYDMWSSLHFSEHSVGSRPCPKVIHIQSTLGTVMRALISGSTDPLSYLRKGALKTMHGDLEEFFRSNKSNADISARAAKVALELLLYRTTEINDRLRTCKHCQSLHAFHVERPKRKWSFASHWCRMLVKAPHVPALYDRLLELAETTFVVWPEELDEDHVESLIDWLKHFGDSARLIAAVQDCHLRFREYDERSIWRIFRLPPVDAPTATDMDY
ncbi:hypothetical protein C8F01DRAFT_1251871 [Mycena amicta]|nr:hypothetical protein C8F01DRAFT_1251871 [Mycena amicta]